MVRFLVGFIFISTCVSSFAESLYEKLDNLYAQGNQPNVTQFQRATLWAGKAVGSHFPQTVYGSALTSHFSQDPIAGSVLYLVQIANRDENHFLTLSPNEAKFAYSDSKSQISSAQYSQANTSSDPFVRAITFTYLNGGIHLALREAMYQGQYVLVMGAWCALTPGCRNNISGETYYNGEKMGYDYFYQNVPVLFSVSDPLNPYGALGEISPFGALQ